MTIEYLLRQNAAKTEKISLLEVELAKKNERIAWLEQRLFGSKKDRAKQYDGPGLFDDLENEAIEAQKAEMEKAEIEVEKIREQRRQRAKRASKDNRPAKYHYYGLEERREVRYPEGVNPDDYDKIDEEIIRILHRDPAKLWVEVIVLPKLRAKSEKNALHTNILQAAHPKAIIGGNHVGAEMLAQLVVDKYVYHIPEYRQAKIYASLGAKLPTSTMNDWMHRVAAKLYPLYESQCEMIRQSDYLQVDEVRVNVADRKGKPCRKGYTWQFRDMRVPSRGCYFHYQKGSREGAIARAQLRDFKGAIQTDGYKVYDYLENVPHVTLLGCMAHARRKFIEAQNNHPLAAEMVNKLSSLYTIESELQERHADVEEIYATRQRLSKPILDGLKAWMEEAQYKCTPDDSFGHAIAYAYKLWPRLSRYIENGRYQIDNNPVERGQRPIAMGRKNYLFSQNDRGAEDNAVFYTMLESCEILGIDPLKWLTHVLEHIKDDMEEDELIALLPYNQKNLSTKS